MPDTPQPPIPAISILVVEDRMSDQQLLKRCLDNSRLNIASCVMVGSLADAKTSLRKKDFDVILTDLSLPDCRGLETVSSLLAVCENAALLVMTDADDDQILRECLSGGAEDFIPKQDLLQVNLNRCISYALLRNRARRDDRKARLPKTDDITELLTRFALIEAIGQSGEICEQTSAINTPKIAKTGAIIALSIDNFTDLVDLYGMAMADHILHQASIRVLAAMPESSSCARIAHHEFACWLPQSKTKDAEDLAEYLQQQFDQALTVKNALVNCRISIGIAILEAETPHAAALLSCATTACRQAREQRSGVAIYCEREQRQLRRRHQIKDEFAEALACGDIDLVYQPIKDLRGNRSDVYEALSRWNHPSIGCIPPLEFVDIAEEFGWIEALDECVLERACLQLANWQQGDGTAPKHLSVNVSVNTLMQPHFPKYLYRCLTENKLDPEQLWLEITESSLIPELSECKHQLSAIRELGVAIAIDDFGTGYSSLAYLGALPVDVLKIDASFIAGIGGDNNQEAILRHILQLGEALKLKVVAEGVETGAQLEALRAMGCDYAQGYFCGRPAKAEKLEREIPIRSTSE